VGEPDTSRDAREDLTLHANKEKSMRTRLPCHRLLTAFAFARMTTAFEVVKRHYPVIMASGGAILIAMGVLIWTGDLYVN
jgi:hypothetical protein